MIVGSIIRHIEKKFDIRLPFLKLYGSLILEEINTLIRRALASNWV